MPFGSVPSGPAACQSSEEALLHGHLTRAGGQSKAVRVDSPSFFIDWPLGVPKAKPSVRSGVLVFDARQLGFLGPRRGSLLLVAVHRTRRFVAFGREWRLRDRISFDDDRA